MTRTTQTTITRTIICGSRSIRSYETVESAIRCFCVDHHKQLGTVIEGEAPGVDSLAKLWAIRNQVPYIPMPATWDLHGRAKAGKIRNQQMLDLLADVNGQLLAIWDGQSSGTADMIERAIKVDLDILIYKVKRKIIGGRITWVLHEI